MCRISVVTLLYILPRSVRVDGSPRWFPPVIFTICCRLFLSLSLCIFFFFQAEDGIRDPLVTGVQTCALPILSDFTKYPDVVNNQGTHTSWYPDPSEPHGKQLFNVFNLDPFVWFVHVGLGFSGYGFSVDDDTADVGAGGASQLQVTGTGTGGLKNTNPWTIQAPYGPVKNILLP